MIQFDTVHKIFGPEPARVLDLVRQGQGKQAILEDTGHVVAVAGVSLTVAPETIFAIMGLSGSGKSTLLRCINRLVEPTSGRVHVDGTDVTAMDETRLRELRSRQIGMVFQHYALFPHRTVLQNVAFGLEVRHVARGERERVAIQTLDLVGLHGWEHAYPDQLSGGMRQRVGLARALAAEPAILLMDEPFSGLDPVIRKEMQRELLRLQAKVHKTIVFITHDLDEAIAMGDRIAIMRDGRVVQEGTPAEIVLAPADDYVRLFVQDMDVSKILTAARLQVPIPYVAQPGTTVAEALRKVCAADAPALLVGDGKGGVMGGLTLAELAGRAAADPGCEVHGLGLRPVTAVSAEEPLRQLLPRLEGSGLPVIVLADGRVQGMVSSREVLTVLAARGAAAAGA